MLQCNQCDSEWEPRLQSGLPVQCPRCKRVDWQEPKKWTLRAQQRAHSLVRKAVKDGTLTKLPCAECGDPSVEAHHENYDEPLDVIWLCRPHHTARHKAIGRSLVNYCVVDHPATQSVEEQLAQRRILGNGASIVSQALPSRVDVIEATGSFAPLCPVCDSPMIEWGTVKRCEQCKRNW